MKLNYDTKKGYITESEDGLSVTAPLVKSPYNVLCIEQDYYGQHMLDGHFLISHATLYEDFEPVENFNYIEYIKNAKKFVNYFTTFKHKSIDYYITVSVDLSEDYDDSVYEEDVYKVQYLYYKPYEASVEDIVTSLNSVCTEDNDHSSKISIILKTQEGFEFKEQKIAPLEVDIDTMYNDDYMEIHKYIVDKLNSGKKGMVLFHGIAGTGKTNLIKHLTTEVPNKKFIFVSPSMIPYLTDPSFINELMDNRGSILVLEDCEMYLKDRETNGDLSGVVSTLLNIGDGMLSDILEIQIICTFNTHIENIDKALTREGRLIAEYYFDKLSVDKVEKLFNEQGIKQSPEKMTLAEIFNITNKKYKTEQKNETIGFNRY